MEILTRFTETIDGWSSWSAAYQSIPAFSALAEAIYVKEGLPFAPLSPLPPGTNAVFRSGGTVIKIFAPKQSGLDGGRDFATELAAMSAALQRGVSAPRLLAAGKIQDRYLFYYLILEYIRPAAPVKNLLTADAARKRAFARQIAGLLGRLNRPAQGVPDLDCSFAPAWRQRAQGLHPRLLEELAALGAAAQGERVLVHGDLTGDNVLLGEGDRLVALDFADALLAPAEYELGPVVFDLFQCDPELTAALAQGQPDFLDRLLRGLAMHQFCGFILKDYFKRNGWFPQEVDSLPSLRKRLAAQLAL